MTGQRRCRTDVDVEILEKRRVSLGEIALAFMTVGLTGVGGSAGPMRHMLVRQKRWLSEGQYAELQGISQALPGAVVVNTSILLTDRFVPVLGPLTAMFALIVPAMALALLVSGFAARFAAENARFAAAEAGVTAALAGIFLSNGLRVLIELGRADPDVRLIWRSGRIAIGALGVVLVAGFHLFVPYAVIILIALSMLIETRVHRNADAA
jgi:chromate transporter